MKHPDKKTSNTQPGRPDPKLVQFPPLCHAGNLEYEIETGAIISDNQSSYSVALLSRSNRQLLLGYSPALGCYHGLAINSIAVILSLFKQLLPSHKVSILLENLEKELSRIPALNEEDTITVSLPEVDIFIDGCSHEDQEAIRVSPSEGSCINYSFAAYVFEQGRVRGVMALDRNAISSFCGSSSHSFLTLSWSKNDVIYEASGNIIRGKNDGELIIVEIGAIQLELMQRSFPGDLYVQGLHPLELVKYLTQIKDFGVTGFAGGLEFDSAEKLFVVSATAQNLKSNDSFVLGDIRFNSPIDTCEEYLSRFENRDDPWIPVWTVQQAKDFAEAQQQALSRMGAAASQIELLSNRDQLLGALSFGDDIEEWDYTVKPKQIIIGAPIYVEDCDSGAYVIFGGNDIEKRTTILVTTALVKYIEQPWVQKFSETRTSNGRHYLAEAAKWLSKASTESFREDQIISLNTALEYAITNEQGDTVFKSIMSEYLDEPADLGELEKQYWSNFFSALDLNVPVLDDDLRNKAEKRIEGVLKSAINRSSFKSRLNCMIERLGNPIPAEDVTLLERVNKIRNKLLHGEETPLLNTIEIEQAIRAASIIVIAKMKAMGEEKK